MIYHPYHPYVIRLMIIFSYYNRHSLSIKADAEVKKKLNLCDITDIYLSMTCVHKYGGVSLPLPHGYGGREDGVQERLVDRLPFEDVGEAGLCELLDPGADWLAEAEKGRGHRVDIT